MLHGFLQPEPGPPRRLSLIAEVTSRPGDATDALGPQGVLERTVYDLDRIGILRAGDLIATNVRRVEYAYPVYNPDYARNARTMREYFESIGVHLLGRFAQFDYINSDECIGGPWPWPGGRRRPWAGCQPASGPQ